MYPSVFRGASSVSQHSISSRSDQYSLSNYSACVTPLSLKVVEISHWSDTTESTSNSDTTHSQSNSDEHSDSSSVERPIGLGIFQNLETDEMKLERWKNYYDNQPLMRSLDTDEEELLQNLLFERLIAEIESNIPGMDALCPEYRGEWKIREFWDDVRAELADTSPVVDGGLREYVDRWDYSRQAEERECLHRTVDGKDPELVEVREMLMKKLGKRRKLEFTNPSSM